MKIGDLAELLGKTRSEIEEMLRNEDVIELKLSDRKPKRKKDFDNFKMSEIENL